MYFPDRGCVRTLLILYVYATDFFYRAANGTFRKIGRISSKHVNVIQ